MSWQRVSTVIFLCAMVLCASIAFFSPKIQKDISDKANNVKNNKSDEIIVAKGKWEIKFPKPEPSARWGHVMVFNPQSNKILLYGGNNKKEALTDTWEWDGNNWERIYTKNEPKPSFTQSICYDSKKKRMILLTEKSTYEYVNKNWNEIVGQQPDPAPRIDHAIGYIESIDKVIMFGGDIEEKLKLTVHSYTA